jgi:aromatic-L-amino-acid decarboxylase
VDLPIESTGLGNARRALTPEQFRKAAYEHADWIANYFEHVRDFRVTTASEPGDLIRALPQRAPEQGQPIEKILAEFQSDIFPALTLWNHPRFFAWFSVSSTPPSVLAEFLTAALNVNAMLWKACPGATELEQVTLSWVRQWLGLDESFFGIIYDTASLGVMQAIGAARERSDPECRTKGMRPGLTVYVSEHTHFSAEKAAITLGFGQENVRRIPVDDAFRMRSELLEEAIRSDIEQGKRPCCIVASVGSTSTSAVEPVSAISDIAQRYGVWLHVDAAYGGSAAVLPEMNHIWEGVAQADSVIFNPHKWLYVSIDCSVLYTRHPDILRRASALSAVYVQTTEDNQVVNFNEYGVQLGRRFRALKLWYVLRFYGRQGIVSMLRESLRLAQLLKVWIEQDADFEVAAPVPLSLVCFRHRAGNEFNEELLRRINASGKVFLSQTILRGRFVLRLAVGNFQTTEQDVREAWELIRETAHELARDSPALAAEAVR